MLGWGYRFCEKKMLIESEMTEKEADIFIKMFDKIYKSEWNEEAAFFRKHLRTLYESKMKVYDLI